MSKKVLQSKLVLNGIAPNLLLKDVEVTAPWLFQGEISTEGEKKEYLKKLVFYKKNLKLLGHINLTEYFYLCMSAHWATAGTFVPTNVDNQIREGLWRHGEVGRHIEKMARITIESWLWDYEDVTNRKSYNLKTNQVMSTHEGTWLSVAIGAYCALKRNKREALANEVYEVILAEVQKEEKLLLELQDSRDHINFLRSSALMAHNFGDLDRVIDQWEMNHDDPAVKRIYKLGHKPNESYSKILVFTGNVNKAFLSVENHRHMSLRQPKCLRRSHDFLVPVGPFMEEWGERLGSSQKLSAEEKAEIIVALHEGFSRQDLARGYVRAFRGMLKSMGGMDSLERVLPFDFMNDLKKSSFYSLSQISSEEFEDDYRKKLDSFKCDMTNFVF
jgi:hypothetical protein